MPTLDINWYMDDNGNFDIEKGINLMNAMLKSLDEKYEKFCESNPLPSKMLEVIIARELCKQKINSIKDVLEAQKNDKLYTNVKFDRDDKDVECRYTDEHGWEAIDDIKCYYCNSRGCDTAYENGMVCHADCE